MKKKIFIHIGFHKTATTWFQNNVFSKHPQINYLGKSYPNHPCPATMSLKNSIIDDSDNSFSIEKNLKLVNEILKTNILAKPQQLYGMSYEGFSGGRDWFGGNSFYIADRLKSVFKNFEVKIIIGIRNPVTMIESFYSEYVKGGGTLSLKRLLFSPVSQGKYLIDKCRYDRLIAYYIKLFGLGNVHVFLFEEFTKDSKSIVKQMFDFIQIRDDNFESFKMKEKVNLKRTKPGLLLIRIVNVFFPNRFNYSTILSPVVMISNFLSFILVKLKFKQNRMSKRCNSEFIPHHYYKFNQIINNKLRTKTVRIIDVFEKVLRKFKFLEFKINDKISKYLNDQYRGGFSDLEKLVKKNLSKYKYY